MTILLLALVAACAATAGASFPSVTYSSGKMVVHITATDDPSVFEFRGEFDGSSADGVNWVAVGISSSTSEAPFMPGGVVMGTSDSVDEHTNAGFTSNVNPSANNFVGVPSFVVEDGKTVLSFTVDGQISDQVFNLAGNNFVIAAYGSTPGSGHTNRFAEAHSWSELSSAPTASPTPFPTESPLPNNSTDRPTSSPSGFPTVSPTQTDAPTTVSPSASPTTPTPTTSGGSGSLELNPTESMSVTITKVSDTLVKIVCTLDKQAWMAFGISEENAASPMLGNAVILKGEEPIDNKVAEYVITATSEAGINQYGGDANIQDVEYRIDGDQWSFSFVTSQIGGHAIDLSGTDVVSMAHGEGTTFSNHLGNRQAATVDWASLSATPSTSVPTLILVHGALMVLAWLLIFPIGVLFAAMWGSSSKTVSATYKFTLHRAFQVFGAVLVFTAFAVVIAHVAELQGQHFYEPHGRMGLFTILAMTCQVVVAACRPHAPNKSLNEKASAIRYAWEWAHKVTGYLLVLFGVVTVFLGIELHLKSINSSTYTGFLAGAIIGCVLIVVLALRVVQLKRKERETYTTSKAIQREVEVNAMQESHLPSALQQSTGELGDKEGITLT